MSVPLLDLTPQHEPHLSDLCTAFERLVLSGQFVLGAEVEAFERQLAACCETKHAVGVSSGTDALLLAMMALDIGPGDEVITSCFTFFATAGGIARLGAKPVFVDIDPTTFNLDTDKIEAAVTSQTKAIIPVHLYGQVADMEAVTETARRHDLKVIEDAAQAILARDGNQIAGSIGDVGCLSFYPTKNLSALGDAGACLTHDDDLADRLRMLRLHGQNEKYQHASIGGNFRIDALQAAALRIKLPHLDHWTLQRRALACRYDQLLGGLSLVLPIEAMETRHVYHQYTIRVPDRRRDALRGHLHQRKIGCEVYYPIPLHLQEAFSYLAYRRGDFPLAEQAADEVLSLPIYPGLSQTQQDEVVDAIREFLGE